MYTKDTIVSVRPFTSQRDGDEVIIGNLETGTFLAIPSEALNLLEQFAQGKSVGEVSDLYQEAHGETPDLDDFLSLLEQKGFVEQPSKQNIEQVTPGKATPVRRYHFSNIPVGLAQKCFGPAALTIYFLLVSLAAAAVFWTPALMPRPRDLFFPDRRTLTWTILIAADCAAVFVHELGHLIAARATGINSRIGISHRLWYVVAETDLTGLWSVPRSKRYLPMLAGILIDSVSAAALILVLFAQLHGWLALPPFCMRLARALAFTYLMGIVWQCFFFLRTDLYYVIATLFNCRSLLSDTEVFLRNQLARVWNSISPVDQSAIPAHERRMIRAYSLFWIGGRIWAVCVLTLVTVPVGLAYLRSVGAALRAGYSANPSNFTDSLVLTLYFLVPTVTGFVMWANSMLRLHRISK